MVHAVIGLVYNDGRFVVPQLRKLGKSLGYDDAYGIRTSSQARDELAKQPDIAGIVFASSNTDGHAEFVGLLPSQDQINEVEDEFSLRKEDRSAGQRSTTSKAVLGDPVPVAAKREGQIPASERELTAVQQQENDLVLRYEQWIERRLFKRWLKHAGSDRRLEIDAFDDKTRTLIEAKSSAHRRSVLLAIGQLFDYGRVVGHDVKLILLPEKPEQDLLKLAHSLDIEICYGDAHGFVYSNRHE